MTSVYTIVKKAAPLEFIARDALGRSRRIQATSDLRVGESVLVSNGVVVRSVDTRPVRTFEV